MWVVPLHWLVLGLNEKEKTEHRHVYINSLLSSLGGGCNETGCFEFLLHLFPRNAGLQLKVLSQINFHFPLSHFHLGIFFVTVMENNTCVKNNAPSPILWAHGSLEAADQLVLWVCVANSGIAPPASTWLFYPWASYTTNKPLKNTQEEVKQIPAAAGHSLEDVAIYSGWTLISQLPVPYCGSVNSS